MIADIASGPSAASESLPGHHAILREASTVYETPENWTIYRRPDFTDTTFLDLCDSIRTSGIKTPLEISSDDYIISGHRRFLAAQHCGVDTLPCFIDPSVVMGELTQQERVALLIERNRGTRIKSDSELYLEAAAAVDPDEAIRQAQDRKAQVLDYIKTCKLPEVQVAGSISRTDPNGERAEMLKAVLDILGDLRAADFLPTSGRSIHYKLLAKNVRTSARKNGYIYGTRPGSASLLSKLLGERTRAGKPNDGAGLGTRKACDGVRLAAGVSGLGLVLFASRKKSLTEARDVWLRPPPARQRAPGLSLPGRRGGAW